MPFHGEKVVTLVVTLFMNLSLFRPTQENIVFNVNHS